MASAMRDEANKHKQQVSAIISQSYSQGWLSSVSQRFHVLIMNEAIDELSETNNVVKVD